MNSNFDEYANYYELLYEDKNYLEESVFIRNLLLQNGVNLKGSILELGCGTGKHAEILADFGYTVHGIDLSPNMINIAKEKCAEKLGKELKFDIGDVRSVRIDGKFEGVISLFHVASYQTETKSLLKMFETAAFHLKPNGIFLFDCWYGPAVLTNPPEVRVKNIENESVQLLRLSEPIVDFNDSIVNVNFTLYVTDKNKNLRKKVMEQHKMRYLFSQEVDYLLGEAKLEMVGRVEWLSGKESSRDTWQVVFIARKTA
jgi:SAM-dependent methyltransferase